MMKFVRIVGLKNIFIRIGIFFIIFSVPILAVAHGPKGHSEEAFTAFQAVKKGVTLYDKLVDSGKLTESWETDLVKVEVSNRGSRSKKEFVVKFTRSVSDPRTVFIFFSGNGEYKGSNFTGK